MESTSRAIAILQQAEIGLRNVVADAASVGDYDCVNQVTAWARNLREVIDGANKSANLAAKSSAHSLEQVVALDRGQHNPIAPKGKPDTFPRFFRQADSLVRLAWSRKEKKQYQHKATYSTLCALTDAIFNVARDGRVFSTDQLLPLRDGEGTEIPNYQVYVCIALLKHAALIDQHGRQGYSIPRMAEFKQAVEAVWQKLPKQ